MVTKRIAVSAIFAALLSAAAFAQDLSKPVIVINGTSISYGTYYHRMERLNGVGRLSGNSFVPAQPGFLTLQQLINDALMVQLAVEKGVAPTDKEIDNEYAEALKENPDSVKNLLSSGITEDDIREQFRISLSEFKLETMGINIGDQQVEEYYNATPGAYTTPKSYQLYVIIVDSTDLQDAVDKELNANHPFTEVAKKYSQDPNAAIGGYIGLKAETVLDDRFKQEVASLGKNGISAWVDMSDAPNKDKPEAPVIKHKLKLFVGDIVPAHVVPLTPELRKAIRERLMVDRGRIKNDVPSWMADMRKKVKLDFQGTAFDNDIKQTFQGGS